MNNRNRTDNIAYSCAIATAIICALFCITIGYLLTQNYSKANAENIVDNPEWTELLDQLARQPQNQKLKEEIRVFDQNLRQNYFNSQKQNKTYIYMLAVGGTILIVSLKWARMVRIRRKNIPDFSDDTVDDQLERNLNFQLIIIIGVLLSLTGIAASVMSDKTGDFTVAKIQTSNDPTPTKIDKVVSLEFEKQWPTFRGPGGQGIAPVTNVPLEWDETKNILWKIPLETPGHNSPIVWGDRIFFSAADEEVRKVYCLDASDGKILWEKPVLTAEKNIPEVMEETGFAAPTMVTNGKYACAIFANGDLVCFDFDGKEIWIKNLGLTETTYGYSSSLAIHKDILIVQYDQGYADDGLSKMLAFDIASGNIKWQQKRPVNNSWSSPVILFENDKPMLITTAEPFTICNDPLTGKELWKIESVEADIAPTAVFGDGIYVVIAPNYYAKGITVIDGKPEIKWEIEDNIPDTCSPLANDNFLWLLTSDGNLACFEIKSGQLLWVHEFEQEFQASPVLVGDKVLLTSHKGETFIVEAASEFKLIGSNKLQESVTASPAIANGIIYIRTKNHLFAIGKK
ncbi:MAG: PQQ-binding-like beta-propeller repeat protein [Phycisphaerae bacterium]|nr:PQQ-binding-like beta-propeller repeat protein [Phycisphaerae bacterium]